MRDIPRLVGPDRHRDGEGLELSRKTMCGWMAEAAWLPEPIWKAMRAAVLKSRVVQTDDTPVPVLDRRLGRQAAQTGRVTCIMSPKVQRHIKDQYALRIGEFRDVVSRLPRE
jgi:hypothetical protein